MMNGNQQQGGLLSRAQQSAGPAAAPAAGPAASGQEPTAEEQQWYEAVQQAGADILFNDDKASETVLSMINPKQPGLSAGNAAAEVMLQIDRGMDGEVPESVILPAGEEILEHVLDIGQAAKLLERSPELDEEAAQAMAARLLEEYGVDEQGFAQAQQATGFKPPAGGKRA